MAGPPHTEALEGRTLFSTGASADAAATLPRPDHVVIVVEENHDYGQILGPAGAGTPGHLATAADFLNADPYIRTLAKHGASLTDFHAETHPSQPNYVALFSGSTQGLTSDAVPDQPFTAPSLGGSLRAAGLSFAGYSEGLPSVGFTGASAGDYARKHNPWSDFADVPPEANRPLSDFPAKDFGRLPTVSFLIPGQQNDMHSGQVRTADQWLRRHTRKYLRWAQRHNSLLIVTWDEGAGSNHIPTILAGAGVRRGPVTQFANHYNLLRTIEDMYGLAPLGESAAAEPMRGAFE